MRVAAACSCGPCTVQGPGLIGADVLYRSRLYAERCQGGKRLRRRESDFLPGHLLLLIMVRLMADAPVLFRLDDGPDAASEDEVRTALGWLHEHQFIALEGIVDGIARAWVNPAVAALGGTDPRIAAARHRFPFIDVAEDGMKAEEPVTFHPYDPELWQAVYEDNQESFDQSTFLSWECPRHGRASMYPRPVPSRS